MKVYPYIQTVVTDSNFLCQFFALLVSSTIVRDLEERKAGISQFWIRALPVAKLGLLVEKICSPGSLLLGFMGEPYHGGVPMESKGLGL